jgi:hypothetical protein
LAGKSFGGVDAIGRLGVHSGQRGREEVFEETRIEFRTVTVVDGDLCRTE